MVIFADLRFLVSVASHLDVSWLAGNDGTGHLCRANKEAHKTHVAFNVNSRWLQIGSALSTLGGFYVIYTNKNMNKKPHFTTGKHDIYA